MIILCGELVNLFSVESFSLQEKRKKKNSWLDQFTGRLDQTVSQKNDKNQVKSLNENNNFEASA